MIQFLSQQKPELFKDKRVLVRLDLNVPLSDNNTVLPTDIARITASLPTIEFLKNAHAKIIIISHIGRDPGETLQPVADYLQTIMPINFVSRFTETDIQNAIDVMQSGDVVMLQNLRSQSAEESNDDAFVHQLASYADFYINDAFAVSHRAHASIVGVPKILTSFAGFQMEQEIAHLNRALDPRTPSVLIMGGAKFETKLPVIDRLLPLVDHVIIGGALANNFFRAAGYEIGKSLYDETADIGHLLHDPKILIPEQVVVQSAVGNETKSVSHVLPDERIVDIAPASWDTMADIITGARTIIWNGPMGNYENHYVAGTESLIRLVAQSAGDTIVGGGDSIALIEQLDMAEKFTFLSTAGGAMLNYLAAGGHLVGIDALDQKND